MKSLFALAILLLAVSLRAAAQDMVRVAPELCKVILENESVRVIDVRVKPGDVVPMHSHGNAVTYCVSPGASKTTTPDGKTVEAQFKAGEARWSGPVTHANESTTNLHLVVVELKENRGTSGRKK